MIGKRLVVALVAVSAAIGISATAADAAKKRPTGHPAASVETPSLDGRVLGYPRTCWSEMFLYDSSGTTTGPYCH
jgi:hypothetical protein